MPQIRLTVSRTLMLAALLGAGPALAQGVQPQGAEPQAAPAGAGRAVTSSGQTMPRPRQAAGVPGPKTASDPEALKAQKASEARSKSWDDKMHKTMGTICHGC